MRPVLIDPAPPSAAPAAATPEQRRTLAMASAGTLLVLITFVTPLATGVRTTVSLGAGPGTQAWLLSAMSVGLAAALLTAGVLADDVGRRRVFTGGLLLVGIGAGAVAVAPSSGLFIAARLLEGIGAAAVIACALGLIGHAFPMGPARSRATAVWGASVGAGTGLGGLVTVGLDHGAGWRTTYVVTAVAAVVLAGIGRVVLIESVGRAERRVDVAGVVLLAAGVSALLAGLVQSRGGWGGATVVLLAAGVLLLAAFVRRRAAGGPADDRPVPLRRPGVRGGHPRRLHHRRGGDRPGLLPADDAAAGARREPAGRHAPRPRLVGREHGHGAGGALVARPRRPAAAGHRARAVGRRAGRARGARPARGRRPSPARPDRPRRRLRRGQRGARPRGGRPRAGGPGRHGQRRQQHRPLHRGRRRDDARRAGHQLGGCRGHAVGSWSPDGTSPPTRAPP